MFKFVQKAEFKNTSATSSHQGRRFLWLLPFFGFVAGYIFTGFILHKADLATPNVIGKPLREGLEILSKNHLGIRLLQQREDATLPEGTVLDQLPRPDQKVRANQHVFLTISTKQRPIQVTDFWGKKGPEIMELIAKQGLDVTMIKVPSPYPEGLCIAQLPGAGKALEGKKITLYFSDGKNTLAIMPNLKGSLLSAVQEALSKHDIRAEIFHAQPSEPDHICSECKIVDQQPVPGAIIDMSRGLHFQFKVITVS